MNRALPLLLVAAGLAMPAARAQAAPRARVLFLTGGSYHDYRQAPKILIQDLQKRLGRRARLDFTLSQDLDLLRHAGQYGLIMLDMCQQTELSPAQKAGLLDAVRGGVPLVALHCTFWCFQSWPEFRQMLGAFVPGHAKYGPLCLHSAPGAGSGVRHVPATFELTDEPYMVNERDPSMHVLVRTCKVYPDRTGTEPEVWTKTFGRGRVFAMTFGHDLKAQRDPVYLTLLANGVAWALKH